MRRKWIVLGALCTLFAALFVAGFVSSWVGARDDKRACDAKPRPAGAVTVHVQRTEAGDRVCAWLDRARSTVAEETLP